MTYRHLTPDPATRQAFADDRVRQLASRAEYAANPITGKAIRCTRRGCPRVTQSVTGLCLDHRGKEGKP